MVQGQMGLVLADHPADAAGRNDRSRPCGRQASVRGDDENEKDRHRRHRSGTARNCSRLEHVLERAALWHKRARDGLDSPIETGAKVGLLRLPCAYGGLPLYECAATALIRLSEREGLGPS